MGRGLRRAATVWIAPAVGVLLLVPSAGSSAAPPSAPVDAVLIDDVGTGWDLVGEQPNGIGGYSRTFRGADGELTISGFEVPNPPGAPEFLAGFIESGNGLESIAEPSFDHAAWMVPIGGRPGDVGFSTLVVASRDHVFLYALAASIDSDVDGPAFLLDLARRQVAAAGGEPTSVAPPREVDDAELIAFLPDEPPAGYGLMTGGFTLAGALDVGDADSSTSETADFLNRRSKNAARAWAGDELMAAVGVTEYPFDIFAAAALSDTGSRLLPLAIDPRELPPDAVAFDEPEMSQVGVVFRSDDRFVTVLAGYDSSAARDAAVLLVVDLVGAADELMPAGSTSPYEFPSPPARALGLLLTSLVVTLAIVGSRGIAWFRSRRVRHRWAELEPPVVLPPPGVPANCVVDLDADASALRRSGRQLIVVQIVMINVGIVALAGDFGIVGLVIATAAFVVGLWFSRRWVRREQGLLGPVASRAGGVLPRLPGVVLGVVSFALFGVGVAALMKGARYVIFKPTLGQLEWADRVGLAPRSLGYAVAAFGLAVTFLAAVVFRVARSLGRARVQRVLDADPRPPALYLRSFADDAVPLPAIASARRPFFEMFSLRGADPFEESVAWELNTYAPVVAVGMPGGSLRSLGAAREHLEHATWRDEVAQRMEHAGLIIMSPGETEGLEWELSQVVSGGHLHKTVFVFPPLPPTELSRRWLHSARLMRDCGASVGVLCVPWSQVHTVTIRDGGLLRATVSSTRDEATYRTAVDRAVEPVVARLEAPTPTPTPLAALVGTRVG